MMSTLNEAQNRKSRRRELFTTIANGSAGSWAVDIDATSAKPYRWFAQIEGPLISINMEIPSPSVVGTLLDWIKGVEISDEARGELKLGEVGRAKVSILRDDEFDDRFFLLAGSPGKSCVRLTLAGQDLSLLMEALTQVREELRAEGLI